MRPRLAWVTGLFLALVPGLLLAAEPEPLSIEDVLRLHFAGVGDEVIISEIIVTGTVYDLDVEDILRLSEAGLSDRLVKFMIDTKLTDNVSSEDTEDGDYYYLDESEEEWVNVIEEEPEATTTYHVSLNYNYGSWWYGSYWWDYWYWDCGYAPYRNAFVFSVGAWYPGWYSYGWCYTPAWSAYRARYCSAWGYPYYGYSYCDPYYYYDGSYRSYAGLSQTKYKIGGSGSSGSSGGKYVAAGPKLNMGDGTRLTATKSGALASTGRGIRKTRDGKTLLVDRGPVRDAKRPVKTVGSPVRTDGRGVRKPSTHTQLVEAKIRDAGRTPTRGVRSPASGERPTKIRVPQSPTRSNAVKDRTRSGVRTRPGSPSSVKSTTPKSTPPPKVKAPTRSPSPPAVRSAPRSAPKRAPAVKSRPAPRSGGGKRR